MSVNKLLECVFQQLGPGKVKEMVLHSPNEEETDTVVFCAALNGETDLT